MSRMETYNQLICKERLQPFGVQSYWQEELNGYPVIVTDYPDKMYYLNNNLAKALGYPHRWAMIEMEIGLQAYKKASKPKFLPIYKGKLDKTMIDI